MGSAATRAKNKYNAKTYDRISLIVPRGEKEKIRQAAAEQGISMCQYVYAAILDRMQEDGYGKS